MHLLKSIRKNTFWSYKTLFIINCNFFFSNLFFYIWYLRSYGYLEPRSAEMKWNNPIGILKVRSISIQVKISSLSQIPYSTWLKSSLARQSIKEDKHLENCYFPNIKEFTSFKCHIALQSIFMGFLLSCSRYKNISIVNVKLDHSLSNWCLKSSRNGFNCFKKKSAVVFKASYLIHYVW